MKINYTYCIVYPDLDPYCGSHLEFFDSFDELVNCIVNDDFYIDEVYKIFRVDKFLDCDSLLRHCKKIRNKNKKKGSSII